MSFNGITISSGNVYISNGRNPSEKTNFGAETVSMIDVSSSVRLNGTTVEGTVDAGGSITATNANVDGKIDVGGSATIIQTTCRKKIETGGSIRATNSTAKSLDAGGSITVVSSKISHKVDAGGSITANRCEKLGRVDSGGSANIDECPSIESISAGGHVTLQDSTVLGDVSSGTDATVRNSKIHGTLSCPSNHLVIEDSEIDTIDLRCANSMSISAGGMSIRGGTVRFGNNVVMTNGGGSICISNGNIMLDSNTNPNNVFIDGVPLSHLQQASSSQQSKEVSGPKQILELRNCTVRNVIFEGQNGEVILSEDSTLSGNITGGKVQD